VKKVPSLLVGEGQGEGDKGKAMLTEEERRDILKELENCENSQSVCLEALKIVQGYRGYVSDDAIKDIAPMFGLTPDELDSIATFYSYIFRKPVGRHLIFMCDGVSCWIMGFEGVFGYLKERLGIGFGETTSDGKFTLLPVSCIGACDHAPALLVDDKFYGDLDRQKIDEILNSHT
jgi:NADH-quinone oxidoreductase subunit E